MHGVVSYHPRCCKGCRSSRRSVYRLPLRFFAETGAERESFSSQYWPQVRKEEKKKRETDYHGFSSMRTETQRRDCFLGKTPPPTAACEEGVVFPQQFKRFACRVVIGVLACPP